MYEKLDIAISILHRTKVKVYESLACAEISPKSPDGISWLRLILTYPVDKVIRFSNKRRLFAVCCPYAKVISLRKPKRDNYFALFSDVCRLP